MLSVAVKDALYTRPWLRAYADAPKKTVEQFVADTLLAVESIENLRLKRLPERLPTFDGDANDEHEIDDFAASVRDAADVTTPHVPNVTRAAERLGCIVLPMDNELGKHMGMSMFVDGTPVIRVARPSAHIPGDRQRFTIAHELGHLTMHQATAPPDSAESAKTVERQAHRFAGAFLLPADCFLDDLDEVGGRVTLATLSRLKERWGVAIKAMVVRLQQLHRIDSDHARSLYKQISARGWNKSEPMEVKHERALWLSQALSRRFADESPVAQAVSHTGLSATYFDDWSDWSSPVDATVLHFPARR
ncbi:ImmA/IrrE family metallo-endopeptidase [Williamsia muralis]|uniref:ImmA/IrrE family metallo-endopeptidase n=1 Tax=Williamsia marianensis TaxID=85044 RepID=UPI001FAF1C98|nr:ImmA/IrrE family metallo-endopeptidase [Williamsia marianensis]